MNHYTADKLLVFYLSPALGFLVSISQVSVLNYFLTGYVASYIITLLILYKLALSNKMPKSIILPVFMTILLCVVEYVHFYNTGLSLNDMQDIRMIAYSPLYSQIIVFVLYAIYLIMASVNVRMLHLNFVLKLFTYFNVLFIFYWLLLYIGLVPHIENTAFLNANGVSYAGLFVVFVLLTSREGIQVSISNRKYYLLINMAVIFLNTTRGAILIFIAIVTYKFFKYLRKKESTPLFITVTTSLCVIAVSIIIGVNAQTAILGDSFYSLYHYIESIPRDLSYGGMQIEFNRTDLYDDASLSAVGRIFTNYLAFVVFWEYPIIGVGQTQAYAIKVFSEGIHSFSFLLLASAGLIGLLVFTAIVRSISIAMGSSRLQYIALLYVFSVLLFSNDLSAYFVLLFVVCSINSNVRHKHTRLKP